MRRPLKYALAGFFLLLFGLLAALAALLFSESGGRWLLGHVPGLEVQGFAGRLGDRWSAARLAWRQDGIVLELDAPLLDWSPACLLRGTLCIDELSSDNVRLDLPPSQPGESTPSVELPELRLPLGLRLGQARIGRLSLNGDEQLRQLELVAHWQGDGLSVERLSLSRDDLALDLTGSLLPERGWPVALKGELRLPAPGKAPWTLRLNVEGELRDSLKLQADSSGYLTGRLDGELRPLADGLPANARLRADGFKADASLPASLTLNRLELTIEGDLTSGYAVWGQASLPGEGGDLALSLVGQVGAQGADIGQLRLSGEPTQSLELQGRIDWRQALAADGRLQWRDFPWQRLFPQAQTPPVELRQLDAEVRYAEARYTGTFDAKLKGPAGDFSLASPVSGDLASVSLADLRLEAGQGRAQGQVKVVFGKGIGWDGQLRLSELDPSYWLAEFPGKLAGQLRATGAWREQRFELNADLDLQGRLRGQPALLQAKAEGAGQRWTLSTLEARLGNNRLTGRGQLERTLNGQLDLALERLGQLWPTLSGKVQGRLDLAGTLDAPQGRLALTGERLKLTDTHIDGLRLDAQLDAAQRGGLRLWADGLETGDSAIGTLTVEGSGDRSSQQVRLDLSGPLLNALLAFDGKLAGPQWRGRLSRGEIRAGGQDWRLEAPARLERLADGRLTFGAHCWRSGSTSLCGAEQRLLPEPKLDYRLRDFPLASLAHWLPADFAWQGKLNADLKLDLPHSGPNGRIALDAGSGVLRLKEGKRWLDFPYQRLRLESTLQPRRIDSQFVFQGQGLGQLQLQARIDPRPTDKPLSGRFVLDGLDLAILRPFVAKVERLEGRLRGAGSLGGTLLSPRVLGDLNLSDGHLSGGDLPLGFEALGLDARIAGERLALNGQWRSGEQGRGTLSGDLAWGEGLNLDLALRGSHLPLLVEPYANLVVEPDLRVGLADQRLTVSGKLGVPSGKIRIRQLPPQAVKISPDTQVKGERHSEQPPLYIDMDVAVDVGQERLQFSGFGLNADLQGHLKVGDNLSGQGELVLKNGLYRAYGQRLNLRRARLLFAGPLDQPYLDVEAVRNVGDVTAGLRLSGRADEPSTEVFSKPAMSQEQALSYLILGRPLGGGADGNAVGQAALAMGLSGSAPLTSELARRLGLKDLMLDDDGATGQITDRLSIRYGLGVVDSSSVVALRYELTKRLYLEAASGLASSLDLFYKRDF